MISFLRSYDDFVPTDICSVTPAGSHHPRKIIQSFSHDTEGVTYSGVLCVIRIRICSPSEGIYDPFRDINECSIFKSKCI